MEELREGEPEGVVLENARRKAVAGLRLVSERSGGVATQAGLSQVGEGGEGVLALGVDTDVVLDGRLLGKPGDEAGARERLEALSGRTHEVLSGVALVGGGALLPDSGKKAPTAPLARPEAAERVGVARSYVTFYKLTEEVIGLYLASGEWHDRAGAYAIQGLGAILVERLQGDFSNVVGLPVALLLQLAPELTPGTKTL